MTRVRRAMWGGAAFILLASLAFSTQARAQAGGVGALGLWHFDEASGETVLDSSGNGNDGTLNGVRWARGPFGTALHFSGQDSWVALPVPTGLDGSNELTVEAWVYWEGGGRYPNILSAGSWNPGGLLLFVSDNSCSFRMGKPGPTPWTLGKDWDETSAPLLSFVPGRWYHLAASFKRPLLQTYVDGALVGSARWDYPVGCAGEVRLGTWTGMDSCHKGLIDEVKLCGRALSAEEIRADQAAEAARRALPPAGEKPYTLIAEKEATPMVRLENEHLRLSLDDRARVLGLADKATGQERAALPPGYLVTANRAGKRLLPTSCTFGEGVLAVQFRGGSSAQIRVTSKKSYFVFEVLSVGGPEADELCFLDTAVTVAGRQSGMSGLVSDGKFAFCVRSLNLNTDVSVGGAPAHLRALAYTAHGLTGARAALVGCPAKRLTAVLKELIRQEGQPLSTLGGPWALTAPENRVPYLFALPSEKNVDAWIDLARRGGIGIIHLCGWEQSLGSYEPRADLYPHGLAGLKQVADKIHAAGLKVGMHTLTGCVAPNDPFATPVPDRRLAKRATYTLTEALAATGDTLTVAEPLRDLDVIWSYASRGNVVQVDDELIMFSGFTTEPPYRLTGCKRGAFGTKAAAHAQGASAGHLHAYYGAFYPDPDSSLVDEVAGCIAKVANAGQFDFLYMDGSEGMPQSWYGIGKMRTAIFRKIDHPIRIEASEWGHHAWPFHSCVGAWDYPNWGLKRFIDLHCRQNEEYRDSRLMPGQLGWWCINGPGADSDAELPEEVEYLCARTLAFGLGVSYQGIDPGRAANGQQDEYLPLMGQYERLRQGGYFPESVRARLREPGAEFRLRQAADGSWRLWPTDYQSHKVTAAADGSSAWTLSNRHATQPLRVRIQALYTAAPYASPDAKLLANPGAAGELAASRAADGVQIACEPSREQLHEGQPTGRLSVTNKGAEPRAAWAVVQKTFSPELDLSQCGALGVWVYGDGKGEVLNLQLTDPPEYYGGARSDHYIDVDFTGWRYCELLLRERDAQRHADYSWPYSDLYGIYRTPLMRAHVTALSVYVNQVPRGETVTCYLGPIKALPATRTALRNPAITIGDQQLVFPVTLESGQCVEYEGRGACVVRDERRAILQQLTPRGEAPTVPARDSRVKLTWDGGEGREPRARVTLITEGQPLGGASSARGTKSPWLAVEYDAPHMVSTLDGKSNAWEVRCRPDVPQAGLRLEIGVDRTGQETDAYEGAEALTLEAFDSLARFAPTADNQFAKYAWDAENRGVPNKPGVTQKLELQSDRVKVGKSAVRFEATSARGDSSGWCAAGERFSPALDLSPLPCSWPVGLRGRAGGDTEAATA